MALINDDGPRRVLIIDDEPVVVEVLDDLLSSDGYDVQVAVDGYSGRAKLEETRWDAVLLDVMLPDEDGLELLQREYPTDIGPVDLLCHDAHGGTVAVEVKRRGEIDGVEQLARYLERLIRRYDAAN